MVMSDQEFHRIQKFLKGKYGIDMSNKKEIINGRLENYMRLNGYSTYHDFMQELEADSSGNLERTLVNILTTNHTYFMRESEHFDYLKQEVLPYLKKKHENDHDIHIWCAASSTGEEPYGLAMTLMDFFGLEKSKWDSQILATDISTEVLSHAQAGIYDAEEINTLPSHWKRRYFRALPSEDKYKATDELKKEVLFRKFNLMDPFPFRKPLDVIFIRNVMIYFDNDTKRELIKKAYKALAPGGYLFVGRTETIDRDACDFMMIKPSIFRKKEGI